MSELELGGACPVPPRPGIPRVLALKPWDTCELDLLECDRLELVVTLYEHEKAGIRPDMWPQAVRKIVDDELGRWIGAHTERVPVAVTYGATTRNGQAAVVAVLHHKAK